MEEKEKKSRKRDKENGEQPRHRAGKAYKDREDRRDRARVVMAPPLDPDYRRDTGLLPGPPGRRGSKGPAEPPEDQPRMHIVQRGPGFGGGGGGGSGGGNGGGAGGAGGGGPPPMRVYGTGVAEQARASVLAAQSAPAPAPAASKRKPLGAPAADAPLFQRCTFMDEDGHINIDQVHAQLMESGGEFTVIAAIGPPGAGKSTLLSLLLAAFGAARLTGKGEPGGGAAEGGEDGDFRPPLPMRSGSALLEGAGGGGIELCVSSLDRLLLLELQLSGGGTPAAERADLERLLFVASIAHGLVLAMDSPVDLELWASLQAVAALRPKAPDLAAWVAGGLGEGAGELPRLLLALNHADDAGEDWSAAARAYFRRSPWGDAPSLSFCEVPTLPGWTPKKVLSSDEAYRAGLRLREAALPRGAARGRFGREGLQLTERQWLYQAAALWDYLRKAKHVTEQHVVDRWLKVNDR